MRYKDIVETHHDHLRKLEDAIWPWIDVSNTFTMTASDWIKHMATRPEFDNMRPNIREAGDTILMTKGVAYLYLTAAMKHELRLTNARR